jgi:hypothetical protein
MNRTAQIQLIVSNMPSKNSTKRRASSESCQNSPTIGAPAPRTGASVSSPSASNPSPRSLGDKLQWAAAKHPAYLRVIEDTIDRLIERDENIVRDERYSVR